MAITKRVLPPAVRRIIAALRSGNYKQITGSLGNKEEGFCVIGLIGNLLFPEEAELRFHDGALSHTAIRKLKNGVKWDGTGRLFLGKKEVCPSLMGLNDEGYDGSPQDTTNEFSEEARTPYTFEELADCIEWTYLYA